MFKQKCRISFSLKFISSREFRHVKFILVYTFTSVSSNYGVPCEFKISKNTINKVWDSKNKTKTIGAKSFLCVV